MECPRCGAEGFTGVCSYCGFPVTKTKLSLSIFKFNYKRRR